MNFFVLSLKLGEFVAPEKIENVYNQSAFVAQCFVDGDSTEVKLLTSSYN